ncbi:MAG TPA: alpha/beta hydrolase [Pararobbsia sp.]|nr:alpha/beta hydrolase [Pararobbsia sp.]
MMLDQYRIHRVTHRSWQSRAIRALVPLVVSMQFQSSRTSEPDVARLRARANRMSWPGRMVSRILHPQIEHFNDGLVDAEWTWDKRDGDMPHAAILYLHGGAYYFGSAATHRAVAVELARRSGISVFMPDYRLAPEHPFPAALDDAISAYHALLARGFDSKSIVLAGDSAGGGLAMATLIALRDRGEPMPAGAVLFSPWVDLSSTGSACRGGPGMNIVAMETAARMYVGHASRFDPLASPARAYLGGLPPIHIHVSDSEALYGQSSDLEQRLRRAEIPVELYVWESMPHAWHCFTPLLPEARSALRVASEFVTRRLGAHAGVC